MNSLRRSFNMHENLNLAKRENRMEALLLILAIAAGMLLRLHGLRSNPFSYDEIALYIYALTGNIHGANQEAPLMAWLLYAWFWLLHRTSAYVSNLLPALIGVLVIPAAWLLARTVYNRKVALIAAWLVAVSPTFLYYSQMVRPYALFLLLSTLLYWCFLRAWNSFSIGRWVLYTVLMTSCFATHALAAQIAVALGIVAVAWTLSERSSRAWLNFVCFSLTSIASGIGILWILMRGDRVTTVLQGIYPKGIANYFADILPMLGFGGPWVHPNTPALFALCAVLPAILAAIGLFLLMAKKTRLAALLFAALIVVTLLVNYFTLGIKGTWGSWPRYIAHIYVPFLVLAVAGAVRVTRAAAHPRIVGGSIAVLVAFGLFQGITASVTGIHGGPGGSGAYKEARYINAHRKSLRSIIVLPYVHDRGTETRITNILLYYRKNDLPLLQLVDGKLRRLRPLPTRGHLGNLVEANPLSSARLTSGRIAIVARRPLKSCTEFARLLHKSQPIAILKELRHGRLTVCDIDVANS